MAYITPDLKFIQSLREYFGRYIEIVTGRNAYTINKEKHANQLNRDGVYLLLENPPKEGMKQTYDKALILPANVVDKHFTTNDPTKIKSSFHLPADTVRFKFSSQIHRIYEFPNPSFIIKVIEMNSSRRSFKCRKEDLAHLWKHNGSFIFLCITPGGRLIDVIIKNANLITLNEGQGSREIPIDLSAEGIDRLRILQTTPSITSPNQTAAENLDRSLHQATGLQSTLPVMDPKTVIDNYLMRGTEIIITLPEGKDAFVLKCIITDAERVHR